MTPRATAISLGEKRYFTGLACKHGHVSERVTATGVCCECLRKAIKLWASRHPARMRARTIAWKTANVERIRAYGRKHKEKRKIQGWVRQGYPKPTYPKTSVCEICGSPPSGRGLSLDHCHVSGVFRGWLCFACNAGLGMFKDKPDLLNKAIEYLDRSKTPVKLKAVAT